MTKQKEGIEIPDIDFPTRCGAKTSSGKPCRKRPLDGAPRCRTHGGLSYGRPRRKLKVDGQPLTAAMVREERSKYINKASLPEIVAKATALSTAAGRATLIATNAALVDVRTDALPETPEAADTFIKGKQSVLQHVSKLHEMDGATPQAAPTLVIQTFDDAKNTKFIGRQADGSVCNIRLLDGEPYIVEDKTGIMYPAIKQIDADTEAVIYVKLLSDIND